MARVVIASGRPVELSALADIVRAAGHEVVGEADTGRKALLFVRDVMPELVMISTDLPMFNAPDFMRRLGAIGPKKRTRTLLYGDADAKLLVQACYDAGIDGFVGRHENVDELRRAVTAILSGHRYFPSREILVGGRRKPEGNSNPLAVLTERELTVMAYLARGMGNSQIAEELALSHKTVSAHRSRLSRKLDVRSIIDLAQLARRYGLVGENEASGIGAAQPPDLSEREATLLRKMLDGTPLPLHLRDTEGRLVSCNQAFLDMHHMTLATAIGTHFSDLTSFDAVVGRDLDARYRTYLAEGRPVSGDRKWVRNGKQVSTHIWMTPYRNGRGELLGMVCGSIDLTGREDLVSLLALQRDSAEALANSIGHLLEALCDELTPASALLRELRSALDLEEKHKNPELDKRAEFVGERLERIALAVKDLLALQYGSRVLVFSEMSPEFAVREVVNAAQPAAHARGCVLKLATTPDADKSVLLDRERFSRVFHLLLGRQVVAGTGGRIDVAIDVQDWSPDTRRLTVEISQAAGGDVPQHNGALGEAGSQLAWLLCRRYVELMHGSLTMDDWKHGGPRVTMSLLVPAA
ncbi:MAG TPA: LuxR C-terminal-related transcriptional regulator [Paraburkholderia sp.]|uniref:LuxR C-terminal-related transcriptional regulator n=1 Tax=Paraburkholderia sp. TaxID=1926495 RepID=UPI002BA361A3|nr:LuxR C-terminal-related transcriptional regulator [Paraburkholderia sp.]HTR05310.1 LuxR C-terminal-related transcriptional regulator [Paraburkholderia sp.]